MFSLRNIFNSKVAGVDPYVFASEYAVTGGGGNGNLIVRSFSGQSAWLAVLRTQAIRRQLAQPLQIPLVAAGHKREAQFMCSRLMVRVRLACTLRGLCLRLPSLTWMCAGCSGRGRIHDGLGAQLGGGPDGGLRAAVCAREERIVQLLNKT